VLAQIFFVSYRISYERKQRQTLRISSTIGWPGADGLLKGSLGMTTSDGSEGLPSPASFSAVTRNMYSVNSTRSLNNQSIEETTTKTASGWYAR